MRSRMLALIVVGATCGTVPAVAGVGSIAVRPLPNDRTGVVVDWRAKSGTATVALRSGRMLAVHSLRRVTPGTRVRVDGIKWGRPTSGIKWTVAPQGIKWGIKWARNGSYSSNLRTIGRRRTTPVRGVVVRRFGGAVSIGTPGGLVVVRMAVWLPGGGTKKSANGIVFPVRGDTITTNVRIGPRGRLHGDGARIVARRGSTPIPLAGRLSTKDVTQRRIVISNFADRSFPVHIQLAVPTTIDMGRLAVGSELAATASITADGTLRANEIGPNQSFDAANDPAGIQVAPPPADADTLDLIRRTITRWNAGRAAGEVSDQVVFDAEVARLQRAEAAAVDGNRPVARAELDAFINAVNAALPQKVTPQLAADVLALASAALDRLR